VKSGGSKPVGPKTPARGQAPKPAAFKSPLQADRKPLMADLPEDAKTSIDGADRYGCFEP